MAMSRWLVNLSTLFRGRLRLGSTLFCCFEAILYELLIAGLIDLVYQSGAYEAFTGVLMNKGKWYNFFHGNRGRNAKF